MSPQSSRYQHPGGGINPPLHVFQQHYSLGSLPEFGPAVTALLAASCVEGAAFRADNVHGTGKKLRDQASTAQDQHGERDLSECGVHADAPAAGPAPGGRETPGAVPTFLDKSRPPGAEPLLHPCSKLRLSN